MQDVRRESEVGGGVIDGAPIPLTNRDAVAYMVHRLYLRSTRYRGQQWLSDTAGLDPDVFEFFSAFKRLMENLGVPVHADVAFLARPAHASAYVLGRVDEPPHAVDYASRRAFSLVHSIRGRALPLICWDVFRHCGIEAAGKVGVEVLNSRDCPWLWIVK